MMKIKKTLFPITAVLFIILSIYLASADQITITSCLNDSHSFPPLIAWSSCENVSDGNKNLAWGYRIDTETATSGDLVDVEVFFAQTYIDYVNVTIPPSTQISCVNNLTIKSGDSGLIIGNIINDCTEYPDCDTGGSGNEVTHKIIVGSSETSIIIEGVIECYGEETSTSAFTEVEVFGSEEDLSNESVEYDQFELILSDSSETSTNIVAMDYDNDDEYTGFGAFVGYDDSGAVLGIADLYQPNQFGNVRTINTGSGGYKAVDVYDTTIWTASLGRVERIGGVLSSLFLSGSTIYNYTDAGAFIDIYAVNSTNAVVCYEESGLSYVQSLKFNTSNMIEKEDSLAVNDCKGIIYDDQTIFYDGGLSGVGLINYTDPTSLSSIDTLDLRSTFNDFGRHDILDISNDFLLSDTGTDDSILIDFSDKGSIAATGDSCSIDSGIIVNSHIINDTQSFLSSSDDGDIYLCDYEAGTTSLVYENPFGEISLDMNLLQEAGQKYVYTYEDTDLLIFTLSDLSVENAMPSFFDTTPDNQYISNLNPIIVGGDPLGLESPVVTPLPLNCVSHLFECSSDAEGDAILFAVDKDYDGSFDSPDWNAFEGVFFTYETAGNYTMRVYLTDDVHENLYSVYRDFDIEVRPNATALGENESTLKFLLKDFNTEGFLSSVFVDVEDGTDGYTNANGVYNEIIDEGVYLVQFTKTNYVTKAEYFTTSPIQQEVFLVPESDPDRRTLNIVVRGINGSGFPNVFVQIQMPYIIEFDFAYTDANGRVTFYPNDDNVVIIVDHEGFNIVSTEVFIPVGSSVTKYVVLSVDFTGVFPDLIDGGGFNLTGCQDHIRGVLLCDYDKVTNCTGDGQCVTGSCAYDGHCSNFNWNLCDEQNLNRGNRCLFKNIGKGVLAGFSNWILDNFFYVLVIILLLIGFLIFALRRK